MKVNIGIREDNKKILFVTDNEERNIGEIEISDKAFEVMLEELGGSYDSK